jgi:hypothetical protein
MRALDMHLWFKRWASTEEKTNVILLFLTDLFSDEDFNSFGKRAMPYQA